MDGALHFRDFHSEPKVDVYMTETELTALNLTNVLEDKRSRSAKVQVTGRPLGVGTFALNLQLDPLEEQADFNMDAKIADLPLVRVNDFLKVYANLDVEEGKLMSLSELRAAEGEVTGYIKVFIDELDVVRWGKDIEEDGFLQTVWEAIAGTAGEIFEDQGKDRLAARIPLFGKIDKPEPDMWATIGSILRNAFIETLKVRLDGLKKGPIPRAKR
jgi:hypothetical protein